ncbi:MAG: hypothetical protein R3C27_02400 [Hyphomonadaceae bacterium]
MRHMILGACAALAMSLSAPALAQEAGTTEAASATVATETAIAGPAFDVDIRRTRGNANVLNAMPRIALVGYNVGAFTYARITASSGGSLFGGSMGARARMEFVLEGVDRARLERIATAAHDDLVTQLRAAGYEVSTAPEVFANGRGSGFLAAGGVFQGEEPGTQSELSVVGPEGVGAVSYQGVGRLAVGGGRGMGELSHELNAILLFPNLALDFVETSGSGNRSFGNHANVQGGARFAVDPMSKVEIFYSRSGRGFFDGWATLQVHAPSSVDDEFASVAQTSSSNNNAMAAISGILGAPMQAGRRSAHSVTADPDKYEELALRAARGFNAAIVAQVRASRGG